MILVALAFVLVGTLAASWIVIGCYRLMFREALS